MNRPLAHLFALLSFLPCAWAQIDTSSNAPAASIELVSEVQSIHAGTTFSLAIQLKHPAGWHSYYQNSGGVEQPPGFEWKLPDGFTAGAVHWPVPMVENGTFGKSFVYQSSPVFLVDITAPANLASGKSISLTVNAKWQFCTEQNCNNADQSSTISLPVGDSSEKDPAVAEFFSKVRARMPSEAGGWKFSAHAEGSNMILRAEPPPSIVGSFVDFIPDQPFLKSVSSGGSIMRDGDAWVLRLPVATKDALDNDLVRGDSFSGILMGDTPVMVPSTKIVTAIPNEGSSAASSAARELLPFLSYLKILGGMLLGGLILNLMPCVFPVIGLKIMGFVQQAGADRKKVVLHGLVFTLGVLGSFAVLSGILFAARAVTGAGSIGWGYQLQNPWVVLSLMLLMFVLGLNMFGVFEIGASATSVGGSLQTKQGISGSFFSGILATIVATPCSAPFLGAAIGTAIGLPAVQFFGAFGAMAIGLSTPYLVLSIFPKLLDFLPRPGAWMESFKQGMSFLLFATAGYLLWVYAGQIDLDHLLGPIFGLSAIAIAAWIHGRWNLPYRGKRTRTVALILTIVFAASGLYLAKPPPPSAINWQPWSEEKVESLLAEGKPVYIDFTAKWCATCQVNKKRAYTPEVIALLNKKGFVTLRADKTKPNPEIEKALQKLGRTAIPVNVVLAPGKDPIILPELLSPADVIQALEK